MFATVLLIVITLVLSAAAYNIWRAKAERSSFNQRFDAYTKR